MRIIFTVLGALLLGLNLQAQFEILELSEARFNITSVKFDNQILFVGGDRGDNTVDYLSIPDRQLTSEQYSSDGLTGAQVLSNDRYAFFYDLSGVNTILREYLVYDNLNGVWSEGTYELINDADHGYIINNTVFLIDDRDTDNIFSFDIETSIWDSLELPFNHREFELVQTDDRLYFVGGELDGDRVSNIEILDIPSMTWSSENLTSARSAPNAIVHNNLLIVHGGRNDFSEDVEVVDLSSFESRLINTGVRNNGAIMVANNSTLILAGDNIGDAIIIDLVTEEVDVFQLEDSRLPFLTGVAVGDGIYLGGGLESFSDLYVYNTMDSTWETIDLGDGREKVEMITCDNTLFVAGGDTPNGETNQLVVITVELADNDGDGFDTSVDCDDTDPEINPDATEIPNNGIDEDCDGADLTSSVHVLDNTVINIYPNPASDVINVEVTGQLQYQSDLYDLQGRRIIYAKNANSLDVQQTPHGTYLLVIKDLKSGQKIVERIVKE